MTGLPAQICPGGLALIHSVGLVFTLLLIMLEEAVVIERQFPPVIVISQLTVFPLARVAVLKVLEALFCIVVPFTLKL